jgi:hypothetical protein
MGLKATKGYAGIAVVQLRRHVRVNAARGRSPDACCSAQEYVRYVNNLRCQKPNNGGTAANSTLPLKSCCTRQGFHDICENRGWAVNSNGESRMRKSLIIISIGLAASIVLAATAQMQALSAKTGLWRMTKTIKWTDLPPQLAAMMKSAPPTTSYNSCVATTDLNSNPWAKGSGDNCTWTVINSTSTDMELQGSGCSFGNDAESTANVHGQIHLLDSENGTGSMTVTVTVNGQTMHGVASYTGKWVAASCPVK